MSPIIIIVVIIALLFILYTHPHTHNFLSLRDRERKFKLVAAAGHWKEDNITDGDYFLYSSTHKRKALRCEQREEKVKRKQSLSLISIPFACVCEKRRVSECARESRSNASDSRLLWLYKAFSLSLYGSWNYLYDVYDTRSWIIRTPISLSPSSHSFFRISSKCLLVKTKATTTSLLFPLPSVGNSSGTTE